MQIYNSIVQIHKGQGQRNIKSPQALDMIHKIFGEKITYRIQEYLVHINYWVTTFSPEE